MSNEYTIFLAKKLSYICSIDVSDCYVVGDDVDDNLTLDYS